ncbi:MAG: TraM recognition domain-containing protein, partial [Candidatus Andersenbacteria bacterium]|nr:TraM recognition domain-containing protein [Candidatus Andersenbacteria bacterium]
DEFQNFATESFAGILSEARKYKLNLIVAHQYIGQLEEEVRDAIFGNVGTIVTFRVGAADAEFLEKEFEPVFMMNDLVNLTKYDIYLKLMIDGVTGDAFSATTLPPLGVTEQSNVEKIIKVSRERYANKREVVEEKISRWSGMDNEDKKIENNNNKKSKESKEIGSKNNINEMEEKEMWDAVCEMCGEKIKVPFKPDPGRSTYCKNCLAEVRKQAAESVKNNKVDKVDFEKKEEEKKIYQIKKKEIKATDSKNSFVGRDVDERKEKSFSVSNNFQIQKNKEVSEKSSNAIIKGDPIRKNVSVEKMNRSNYKDLSKGKNLEIKEGEVVKF